MWDDGLVWRRVVTKDSEWVVGKVDLQVVEKVVMRDCEKAEKLVGRTVLLWVGGKAVGKVVLWVVRRDCEWVDWKDDLQVAVKVVLWVDEKVEKLVVGKVVEKVVGKVGRWEIRWLELPSGMSSVHRLNMPVQVHS